MSVLFIAIPVAIGLVSTALLSFAWAVRQGQFDDLDTPPMRVVLSEEDEDHGSTSAETTACGFED